MATRQQPYDPRLLTMDNGQTYRAPAVAQGGDAFGLEQFGRQQLMQRRARMFQEAQQTDPYRALQEYVSQQVGGALNPQADAYYGVLQGHQNTANQSGRSFNVKPNSRELIADRNTVTDFRTQTPIGDRFSQMALEGIRKAATPSIPRPRR